MSEHTKEPWRTMTGDQWSITDSTGEQVCCCVFSANPQDELDKANARRIVACVNFCEGLTTESMEELTAKGFRVTDKWVKP